MPEMPMNSAQSRAMNCGPSSETRRGLASGYFSLARCRKSDDGFLLLWLQPEIARNPLCLLIYP
jgi:hypothetical protein